MPFEVLLTADAVRDLEEIDAAIAGLARFPARGAHPRELLALGVREYRETFFKSYRVIYRVEGKRVYVY